MTNLNNNELSARTNLHNFCNTVKAGLHSAVASPRKRHALLVLLLLGAALYHRNWPPRRWLAAYGGLDAIRLDGGGDLLREMVREYRTVRRSKEQRIEPVKGGTW